VLYDQRGQALNYSLDAFGRLRVSEPATIFDSKQIFDAGPLYFNTATAGTGAVNYQSQRSSSVLSVGAGGDSAIRQTKRYFNYQPGKGFLTLITFVLSNGPVASVTKRVGYFDANNGIFLQCTGSGPSIVRRTDTSGAVVDNAVAQAAWSVDHLDGTGPSGVTLDFTKAQILYIAFEWLGVGSVEVGFVVDGVFLPAHRFLNANTLDVVYMRMSNLPVRWEIVSTGGNSSVEAICCSVVAEGGQELVGVTRSADTGVTTRAIAAAAPEALVRIRLKSTYLRATVIPKSAIVLATSNENTRWLVSLNPTVDESGGASWVAVPNSAVEYCIDADTGVLSDEGTVIASGYFSNNNDTAWVDLEQVIQLASSIDGTSRDEIVVAAQPLAGSGNYVGSMIWIEPT